MGENSRIEWTDHTFNPWTGCPCRALRNLARAVEVGLVVGALLLCIGAVLLLVAVPGGLYAATLVWQDR